MFAELPSKDSFGSTVLDVTSLQPRKSVSLHVGVQTRHRTHSQKLSARGKALHSRRDAYFACFRSTRSRGAGKEKKNAAVPETRNNHRNLVTLELHSITGSLYYPGARNNNYRLRNRSATKPSTRLPGKCEHLSITFSILKAPFSRFTCWQHCRWQHKLAAHRNVCCSHS